MNDNKQVVYDLMDWAEIEAIVYSEHDNPHHLLGAHVTEEGILISTFLPEVKEISVIADGKAYPMECEDEAGYYAALLPGKKKPSYTYRYVTIDGTEGEYSDPYSFEPVISADELKKFNEGVNYDVYDLLGAHPREIKGISGVLFAVWAPYALRISVVGNFNVWDGRRHMMRRLGDSGVFELFIPGLSEGEVYKYEIKAKGGLTYLKADPYANAAELRPNNASVVADLNKFAWSDEKWMKHRKAVDYDKEPVYIYEVHLGSWKKPQEENGCFYNYRELAVMIADYVKEMGYTHIELMPIMEHPLDASWGYQVTGYYAVTSRYGKPEDFMYFMDYMHKEGIGVILDWVPAHFPRDTFGLSAFDGTHLYEHMDPRQGAHPHWGTLIYNYARPEVSNFLISNALFWVEKYHIDGIRMDAVASMLYLDYGKRDGEWVANENGGNENLEAIAFLQHLSNVFHKRKDGSLLIAEESTSWYGVTGEVKKGGLGFDLKWNMGWMNDFTNYMKQDPLFRKGCHGALTFSMHYAYSEKFVLVLSHDEVVHGKCSMLNKMPGLGYDKFSNLRVAYGFMAAHPGKKLLFMGQDFAQEREWSEERSLDWELLTEERHAQMKQYMKDLAKIYRKYPAFYELDFDPKGFEWISWMDADRSRISFVRKTKKKEESLYVICNFTPVSYENELTAVPFEGKYKEIFNSDSIEYGGQGKVNPRVKSSRKIAVDGQKNSISITIPPLGIAVFSCTPDKKTKKVVKTEKLAEENTKPQIETKEAKITAVNEKQAEEAETIAEREKKETLKKKKDEKSMALKEAEAVLPEPISNAETEEAEEKQMEKAVKKTGRRKLIQTEDEKESSSSSEVGIEAVKQKRSRKTKES